jgi:putative addiction module component (TIGR02574 family)
MVYLTSFNMKDRKAIDDAWAKEAESRIDAYNAGKIEAIPVCKVFEEIERKDWGR